jgi:Tol biopolymer transport system component
MPHKKWIPGFMLIILILSAHAQQNSSPYASAKPVTKPELFAPGIISQGDHESHPAFSPDGSELYFLKNMPDFSFWTIVVSSYKNAKWSEPEVAPFSGQYSDADPFITPDGKRLYFISNRPLKNEKKEDLDIWYVDRTANGWNEPQNPGAPINSEGQEWYPTLASDGTIYFGSDRKGGLGQTDIYRCKFKDGKYEAAENLGEAINSKHNEFEPWISPDQKFMFVMAGRPEGKGAFDLYLSYNKDGTWTSLENLGPEINSPTYEFSPKISPDGKYFFFTSSKGFTESSFPKRLNYSELSQKLRGPQNGLGDIYYADLSTLRLQHH